MNKKKLTRREFFKTLASYGAKAAITAYSLNRLANTAEAQTQGLEIKLSQRGHALRNLRNLNQDYKRLEDTFELTDSILQSIKQTEYKLQTAPREHIKVNLSKQEIQIELYKNNKQVKQYSTKQGSTKDQEIKAILKQVKDRIKNKVKQNIDSQIDKYDFEKQEINPDKIDHEINVNKPDAVYFEKCDIKKGSYWRYDENGEPYSSKTDFYLDNSEEKYDITQKEIDAFILSSEYFLNRYLENKNSVDKHITQRGLRRRYQIKSYELETRNNKFKKLSYSNLLSMNKNAISIPNKAHREFSMGNISTIMRHLAYTLNKYF